MAVKTLAITIPKNTVMYIPNSVSGCVPILLLLG
jgi:hypothetical protein